MYFPSLATAATLVISLSSAVISAPTDPLAIRDPSPMPQIAGCPGGTYPKCIQAFNAACNGACLGLTTVCLSQCFSDAAQTCQTYCK
ncbi:hypothetical protein K505DRAFT_377748 [Melanomma pulvis-pyrius CBS 109.77]|uniref:Extracellular membrane protein CFEM domain-containing protein n=1 Tax=Melanomma pulvis-pyrius CBS 109.77 TaxID=1314802 RepID=A0A6A6X1X6_9PLEO|nr:hypothetical protein K505DRAFT_377748 [Melanomma pulvis-pyrius CBS 109.77]